VEAVIMIANYDSVCEAVTVLLSDSFNQLQLAYVNVFEIYEQTKL
jgi:hypothetical protein